MSNQGICVHSSMTAYEEYIIFSVGNDIIKEHALMQFCAEKGIGCKPLFGMYNGQTERSFIVNSKFYTDCFPWFRNEDCVLFLTPYVPGEGARKAYLHGIRSTVPDKVIGYFKETTKEYALTLDAWTYDPTTNKYYICKEKTA